MAMTQVILIHAGLAMSTSLNLINSGMQQADEPSTRSTQQNKLDMLALNVDQTTKLSKKKIKQWLLDTKPILWLVLFLHAMVIVLLSQKIEVPKPLKKEAKPMMVTLIAPTAPPLMPVIEQPEPVVKTVVKVKPMIKPLKKVAQDVPKIQAAEAEPEPIKQTIVVEPKIAEQPTAAPVEKKHIEEKPSDEKIEPPRFGVAYLNNPAPDYPTASRRHTEQGRVLLKVLVTANGEAENVQIEKSSGYDRLDNAAIEAVKKWQFIPAKKAGQTLSAFVLVPVKFSLN